jgi:hypothetical protein
MLTDCLAAAGHRSIWIIQFALKLVVNDRAINALDIFPVKISTFNCFLTEYYVLYIYKPFVYSSLLSSSEDNDLKKFGDTQHATVNQFGVFCSPAASSVRKFVTCYMIPKEAH